jgi:hypothetical protein
MIKKSIIIATTIAITFILSLVGNNLKLPRVYQYEYIVSIIFLTILFGVRPVFGFFFKDRSNVASAYSCGSSGSAKKE